MNEHFDPPSPAFYQSVPRPAQKWLDRLYEMGLFTREELRLAWNAGAVGWDGDLGQPKVNASRLGVLFASLMQGAVLIIGTLSLIGFVQGVLAHNVSMAILLGLTAVLYYTLFSLSGNKKVRPERIALRLKRLQQRGKFNTDVEENPATDAEMTDVASVGTQKSKVDRPIDKRAERAYLNTIGALLGVVFGASPSGKPYSEFKSEAALIEVLAATHEKTYGISKRTLEEKFAEAKKSLLS